MNENHAKLCSSAEWAHYLQDDILTPLLDGVNLGARMVEFGPGPGAATAFLAPRVDQLTAVELDPDAAAKLAATYQDINVEVITGDCTATGLPDACADSVGTFTMLHHLPTPALQLATIREAWRLLRPGGVLVGADGIATARLHTFHHDDTYNPVDPARLLVWLQAEGFHPITISIASRLTFKAHKPADQPNH